MKNYTIRAMEESDYPGLKALWMTIHGFGIRSIDDSEEGVVRFLRRNPGQSVVAVSDAGEIIGGILCGNDGRRGYIYHTAVNPDYRRRGIGSELVDKALNALKSLGINKVALVVFSRNENGNAFWEKVGFTVRDDLTYRNISLADIVRIDT